MQIINTLLGKSRQIQGYKESSRQVQRDDLETIDRENGNRIWVLSTPIKPKIKK